MEGANHLGVRASRPEDGPPASHGIPWPPSLKQITSPCNVAISPKMKAVELFAGAGGLALGTSQAGFGHEAVIEIDKLACATLKGNQRRGVAHVRDWPIHETDIANFAFTDIRVEVDLLTGGVPCQPFSCAGKGLGQIDHRNMFPEVTRAVRALRPRAVLIENVRGLTRPNFQEYFEYIKTELQYPALARKPDEQWMDHYKRLRQHSTSAHFSGLDYDVHVHLVNAADYGVPQWRERVFIVAFRKDLNVNWTFPEPTHSMDALIWAQYKTGDYWQRHGLPRRKKARPMTMRFERRIEAVSQLSLLGKQLQPWKTVRDALDGLPILKEGQAAVDDPDHFLNPGARPYERHTGSPLDEPAKTLKAGSHGVPGGENTLALDNGKIRYFSVRECARLQTFPDEWAFHAIWSKAMRQVGNAVPAKLARVVATAIRRELEATSRAAPSVVRPAHEPALTRCLCHR